MANLPKPEYDIKLDNYYYNQVLRNFAIQFMAVFSGMQVKIGKNDSDATTDLVDVPIRWGSVDRVVAHIFTDHTQTKPMRIPALSATLVDIQYDPTRAKGTGTESRHSFLPRGGALPDDMTVMHRLTPIPYKATYELGIIVSNTDQHFQILEQIFLLFDPILQLQTGDDSFDWTKIHALELMSVAMGENIPAGTERRVITSTITFETNIWISAPANVKNDVVKKIQMRLAVVPTWANTQKVAEDVNRLLPEYEKLFDVEDFNIPPK